MADSTDEPESKKIKILPPKLPKKEQNEEPWGEKSWEEEEMTPLARDTPSKKTFRKEISTDASTFLPERKRKKKESLLHIPAMEGSNSSETGHPKVSKLVKFLFAAGLASLINLWNKVPVKRQFALGAALCLVFGFGLGRCTSGGASSKTPGSEMPKLHVDWYAKFHDGLVAFRKGDTAKAQTIATELMALNQGDAYYPAGWLFSQSRDRENAIKALDQVPREDLYASDAALLRGMQALKTPSRYNFVSKADGAEIFFKRAIEINPLNTEAHMLYGVLLRAQGRNQSAVDQLNEALLLTRSSDTAFIYHILLKLAENDLNGPPAEPLKNPDMGDMIVESVNLWKNGHKDEAVAQLKKTLFALPPSVQRTIIQDPAFRELPGSVDRENAEENSEKNIAHAPAGGVSNKRALPKNNPIGNMRIESGKLFNSGETSPAEPFGKPTNNTNTIGKGAFGN